MTTTTSTEAAPEPSTTGAAPGNSSTLYPPLVPCPFECPAESGYFEVEPCGPFYCSCTNFDGYLQVCTKFIWGSVDEATQTIYTSHVNKSSEELCIGLKYCHTLVFIIITIIDFVFLKVITQSFLLLSRKYFIHLFL